MSNTSFTCSSCGVVQQRLSLDTVSERVRSMPYKQLQKIGKTPDTALEIELVTTKACSNHRWYEQEEHTLMEPSTFLTRLFFGHHSNTCNTSSSMFCSSPADTCLTCVSAHMQLVNDTCYCRCLLYSHSGHELKTTVKTPLAAALPVTEEQHTQCCMLHDCKRQSSPCQIGGHRLSHPVGPQLQDQIHLCTHHSHVTM